MAHSVDRQKTAEKAVLLLKKLGGLQRLLDGGSEIERDGGQDLRRYAEEGSQLGHEEVRVCCWEGGRGFHCGLSSGQDEQGEGDDLQGEVILFS